MRKVLVVIKNFKLENMKLSQLHSLTKITKAATCLQVTTNIPFSHTIIVI